MNTWNELLCRLTKNGKIEKAAIFHHDGHTVLACSKDFKISEKDIRAIGCAVSAKYSSLMTMKFCDNYYKCFRHSDDKDTLVGKADEEVLVVHKIHDITIVAISHPETPGSSIYEVTKFGSKLRHRMQREKIG
ncbi:hypothetical protein KP79_PYT08287 [Mizuhopecten yessoensis]|uniref:Profilin n=1 Tax=Mizuhopecten yessoensis TaxID=6573 RepID=A0A210R614_MIZYE|nr:hypothetical protein KP79_PYT08287 [Mizuhopecten yessoensis]